MRMFLGSLVFVAGLILGATPTIQSTIHHVFSALKIIPAAVAVGNSDQGHGDKKAPEGVVLMTSDQLSAAKIEVKPVGPGVLTQRLTVPGTIMNDPDKVTHVPAKVIGTVAELRKRLGDPVIKGEIIAIIESREVAEAKSEYLAARVKFELQQKLYAREKILHEKKIIPEQRYLQSSAVLSEARLRMELARQKLAALDLSETEVAALPTQSVSHLRQKEIRAPRSGVILTRLVDHGTPIGGEGQAKELYVIADTTSLWLDLSVPSDDLPSIRSGQIVSTPYQSKTISGRIIFISPSLNKDTRAAQVIAQFPNPNGELRPGTFLTAHIALKQMEVDISVPLSAVHTINGEKVVFVRTKVGFEKREVVIDTQDNESVSIAFGLDPGEEIAVANTFILKADLGKSEAEHSH
ncbi:MAG: efflux RND transporter periplasmic adaptor subunit [Beijerinckiaceae bacterium]